MGSLDVNLPFLENGNGSKSNGSDGPDQQLVIANQHTGNISGVEAEAVHDLGTAFRNKLLIKEENLGSDKTSFFNDSENGHDFESGNQSLAHLSYLPSSRKLVSAMKGSREKEGMPRKELSVSWAADVYDPPPSSASHYPKKSQQQYRSNKRHGKGKHKSKNARCPKDKRHNRKIGGRSDRCLNSYAESDGVISPNNHRTPLGFLDFERVDDVNGPESSCGSSFQGKACGGNLHFAYAAEAT